MSSNPIRNRCPLAAVLFLIAPALFVIAAAGLPARGEDNEEQYVRSRREMVERDLRRRGIRDTKVLKAMGTIPRHLFVPEPLRSQAYADRPVAIGLGQTISQPYIVAVMTELLELEGTEKVLEVGTGSGYQAAVLASVAKEVYSVEILSSLSNKAGHTLARLGYQNIRLKVGDGFFGWVEKSPFDAIVVTAAAFKIPEPLWRQLREGGRLVMPLGEEGRNQRLVRVKKVAGEQQIEDVSGVLFVPLTGAIRNEAR